MDHIDLDTLNRLSEWGGDTLRGRMIGLFLEHGPERMGQIREGLDAREVGLVERGAHSLKSSAANVGALEVSRIAARIEDAASRGAATQELVEDVSSLEEAMEGALVALRSFQEE